MTTNEHINEFLKDLLATYKSALAISFHREERAYYKGKVEVIEELLKNINKDRRMALEAENTEFDYGHNVKHYSED